MEFENLSFARNDKNHIKSMKKIYITPIVEEVALLSGYIATPILELSNYQTSETDAVEATDEHKSDWSNIWDGM